MLISKAQNDDAEAFEQLVHLAFSSDPHAIPAFNAMNAILYSLDVSAALDTITSYSFAAIGIDPETNSLQQLESKFNQSIPNYRVAFLKYIYHSDRFPKVERLDFILQAIQKEPSTRNRAVAQKLMDEDAKLGKNLLGANQYTEWFHANRSKFLSSPSSATTNLSPSNP